MYVISEQISISQKTASAIWCFCKNRASAQIHNKRMSDLFGRYTEELLGRPTWATCDRTIYRLT